MTGEFGDIVSLGFVKGRAGIAEEDVSIWLNNTVKLLEGSSIHRNKIAAKFMCFLLDRCLKKRGLSVLICMRRWDGEMMLHGQLRCPRSFCSTIDNLPPPQKYLKDGLHLNDEGNTLLYDEVMAILEERGVGPESLRLHMPHLLSATAVLLGTK